MTSEIQQNRYDQLIRRVGGLIGPGSKVSEVITELFPMIDVENVPGELLALMGTNLGWASSELLATPAVRNHHQIFNPVGSTMLIVVTRVTAFSSAASNFRFSNFLGAQTTLAGNERRRDTRSGTLASLVAQQRTSQNAVSGGLDYRLRSVGSAETTIFDRNGLAVLFPGTGLTVTCQTLNLDSTVGFMWRERVFETSEAIS